MSGFYVGIAQCGCVRASLVDDDLTTPKEIADFARRQGSAKRRMAHVPAGWAIPVDPEPGLRRTRKPDRVGIGAHPTGPDPVTATAWPYGEVK